MKANMSQLIAWTLKRYVRYLVMGAVVTCAVVNVSLHVGAGLRYICEEECTIQVIQGRISSMNKFLLDYIRTEMLDPPAPAGSYKATFDLKHPPWSKLGRWGDAHDFVVNYFANYKNPGRFVEIGAQDGEFMSLTLHLEERGFEGLLVEPNPKDYAKLRAAKRSSYSINACASPSGVVGKMPLWLRHNSGNLPPLLNRVQEGSNRLFAYVAKEDRDLGEQVMVQCFSLVSMVQAAFRTLQVDLLTISTHGGELDILSTIPLDFLVRMIVVLSPIVTAMEMTELVDHITSRNMSLAYSKSHMHVFLPSSEVKVADSFFSGDAPGN